MNSSEVNQKRKKKFIFSRFYRLLSWTCCDVHDCHLFVCFSQLLFSSGEAHLGESTRPDLRCSPAALTITAPCKWSLMGLVLQLWLVGLQLASVQQDLLSSSTGKSTRFGLPCCWRFYTQTDETRQEKAAKHSCPKTVRHHQPQREPVPWWLKSWWCQSQTHVIMAACTEKNTENNQVLIVVVDDRAAEKICKSDRQSIQSEVSNIDKKHHWSGASSGVDNKGTSSAWSGVSRMSPRRVAVRTWFHTDPIWFL